MGRTSTLKLTLMNRHNSCWSCIHFAMEVIVLLFLNHESLSCEWGNGEGREHLKVKIKVKINHKIAH